MLSRAKNYLTYLLNHYVHHSSRIRFFAFFKIQKRDFLRFYRAMHFSAKRGIAIACRLSVRL